MEQTRQKITRLEKSVERFLTRGEVKEVSDAELATALEERIRRRSQRSFPEALKDARKFLSRVKRGGYNGVLSLAAYRSLARTLHLKGDYARAAEAYAEARTLGRRDSDYRARIDRALIDVHMYRGDMPAARRSARRALAAFEKTGSAVELAKTQVNYANLLHRQDKHRDAEKLYRSAAEVFSREGQQLALARAAYNRANTLLQLFDIDEAERLYQLALDIYTRHDCLLDATDARYGLAWLRMLTGRFHDALLDLNICQHSYRAAGHRRGAPLCELDQAETLLHLNINTEALSAARAAEREFRKQALRYEASKSALFRARAAYTLGKRGEAKSALKRAFAGFQAEGNSGFLASSHLLAASLAQSPGERTRELKKSRGMFKRSQLPLWETLCDLQLALEPGTGARALERLRKSPAAHASPQLHAIWQTLLGDRDEANGQRARARRRWRTAANRLDNLRALLPPVELRTALARQEISPHRRLIAAEMDSNPLQAALWSERFKTAGLWAPAAGTLESDPARRRVSRSLAELAETVATLSHSLASQSGERGLSLAHESGAYQRRLRRVRSQMTSLERDCRLALKQSEGLEEQFRRVARKMSIVQFHLTDSDLIAFVHRRESVKAVRFPGGRMRLSSALGQWRFILEGELLRPHLGNGACVRDEENFFTELGDWLWRPLEIDTDSQRILVIPEGELANLPWEALRIDERSLGDSHDIVQSPSLRHFTRARSVKVNSDEINLFVGRADDLPAVERETKALSQRAGANGRVYRSCRRSDWPESGEYFIWHYSGHSHLRSDNPFYSFLALEDAPLFAADFRLRDARVRLVTLAACRAAEQVALPGEESTGLVRSLLEMGARNVIGGRWSVSDDSTALWMNKFYSALFEGNEISSARRLANRAVRSQKPSAYHWAAFAVYGAGD